MAPVSARLPETVAPQLFVSPLASISPAGWKTKLPLDAVPDRLRKLLKHPLNAVPVCMMSSSGGDSVGLWMSLGHPRTDSDVANIQSPVRFKTPGSVVVVVVATRRGSRKAPENQPLWRIPLVPRNHHLLDRRAFAAGPQWDRSRKLEGTWWGQRIITDVLAPRTARCPTFQHVHVRIECADAVDGTIKITHGQLPMMSVAAQERMGPTVPTRDSKRPGEGPRSRSQQYRGSERGYDRARHTAFNGGKATARQTEDQAAVSPERSPPVVTRNRTSPVVPTSDSCMARAEVSGRHAPRWKWAPEEERR
jgi:hypothetical protein